MEEHEIVAIAEKGFIRVEYHFGGKRSNAMYLAFRKGDRIVLRRKVSMALGSNATKFSNEGER